MKTSLILLFSLALFAQAFAQKKDKKNSNDKLYDNKGYGKYLETQRDNNIKDVDINTLIKMADSYRKIGSDGLSEYLYALIIQQKEDAIYKFYYAQALQANGKYLEAYQYYTAYNNSMQANNDTDYDNRGKILADACLRVVQFKAIGEIKLENETSLNTERLDFSPAYYKNGLVFASTRGRQSASNTDKWINDRFIDLYYAEKKGDGTFGAISEFSKELNSKYHEGPLTFSADGQHVFFTRNDYLKGKRGKSKDKITKLKIYSAKLINKRWLDIREFQYNNSEYDVCHPTLSANGKMLVFSQDAPDGIGGQDLYVCYWKGNRWTKPKNLGAEINTKGNEVFPFLHADGTLFYASNGLGGLGGLDIFMASQIQQEQDSVWASPNNLGTPFNSKSDDFGLILNHDQTDGYLASNREGGLGKDDIYHFQIKNRKKIEDVLLKPTKPIQICVYDKQTNKRLENAQVLVYEGEINSNTNPTLSTNGNIVLKLQPTQPNGNEYLIKLENADPMQKTETKTISNNSFQTNKQGVFVYPLAAKKTYTLVVNKNGYKNTNDVFELPSLADLEEYCVGLDKDLGWANNSNTSPNATKNSVASNLLDYLKNPNTPNPTDFDPNTPTLMGMAINKEYNRPLPNTQVSLLNRCTGEELKLELGSNADFSNIQLECGCDYVLKARKDNFAGVNKIIALSNPENCKQPIKAILALSPKFDKTGEPIQLGGDLLYEGIREGDVIELKNVFYDFNKYDIRPDAAKDLEQLLAIMKRFPSMEIELSSHTDSRADQSYNNTLSSNRANAARDYLTQKGIAPQRIKAVGYGETRPRNNCKDGVTCSEYEHQRNRRTEVFVTKFDQAESTKIQYIDNTPVVVDPKK